MSETPASKPPKHRSPSYPAYDLETTLQRAVQLHQLAKNHRANVATVIRGWGYTIKSSKGLLTIAAIKKFGLAEDQGRGDTRTIGLTQLGRELVYYDSDRTSDAWKERARKAAMTPAIHRELWNRYEGHLPTDSVMKDYLVLQRGFSPSAADEALSAFRRTLAFAEINTSDDLASVPPSGPEAEAEPDAESTPEDSMTSINGHPPAPQPEPPLPPRPPVQQAPAQQPAAARRSGAPLPVNVNLASGNHATLQVTARLTKAEWDELMAVLNAMKGGLTVPDSSV